MDPPSSSPTDADTLPSTGAPGPTEDFLRKVAGGDDLPPPGAEPASDSDILGPASARFEIRRRLGAGGFGAVYEAFDRERSARVALKSLARQDARALYRFKQEFRVLSDISHPNLVQLYELHGDGERWFFTMELVRGQDARSYVRRQAAGPGERVFDERRLRSLLRQLAAGLCFLHEAGKLHRDIKPSNVMVDSAGKVVLLDFGLVVDLTAEGGQSVQVVAGTPHYMAPEQATGDPVGAPADWYAVGVLLYQLLTGRLPFEGSSLDILGQKLTVDPRRPAERAPGVPADLDELCLELLRRSPEARPSGASVSERLAQSDEEGLIPPASASISSVVPEVGPRETRVFVGRGAQLERLHHALEAARAGRTAAALVHGPQGMGKSALVARFLEDVRRSEPDAVILRGRCFEQEAVPYKAMDSLVDALGRYLQRLDEASASALVPRDASTLSRLFPALRRVAAIESAPRRPEAADRIALRRRAFAALRELFARIGDRSPLVVFIDDLQWGDADGGALLAELLRPPDAPSMLAILSYHADEEEQSECLRSVLPGLRAAAGPALELGDIAVGELAEAEARELAAAELGRGAGPAPSADRAAVIARESGGRPYFIQELCLFEGAIDAQPSLDAMLWSRIAELGAGARRLVEVIAVAGQPIRRLTALKAAGLGDEGPPALALLSRQRLLRARGDRAQDAVEAYHDRIRETVLERLSAEAKRELHTELAAALVATGHPDAETLAIHLHAAGEVAKAADQRILAADQAAEALGFERAVRLYRQAIACIGDHDPRRRELHERLGAALGNLGRGPEAALAYLAAASGAEASRALELRRRAAEHYLISGRSDEGIAVLRSVLAATGLSMPGTEAAAAVYLLFFMFALWLRGLGFRERSAASIPPAELLRADACAAVAFGMISARPITALCFHKRYLWLALRAGDPYRALVALLFEAGFAASRDGERPGRGARAIDRTLLPLIEGLRGAGPRYQALEGGVDIVQGAVATFQCRFRDALGLLERGLSRSEARASWFANERALGSTLLLAVLYCLGQWRECARRQAMFLEDARARGDLFLEIELAKAGHLTLLMDDRPAEAKEVVNRVEALWSTVDRSRRYSRMMGLGDTALYEEAGVGPGALLVIEEAWPSLARSGMLHFSSATRMEALSLRGRALLAAAGAEGAEAKREGLLRAALRDARGLERLKRRASVGPALSLRAGVAAGRGDRARARELLAAAEAGYLDVEMKLHAAFCRRRLAELSSGEEARASLEAADAEIRAQAIKDPARMTAMLLPGRR